MTYNFCTVFDSKYLDKGLVTYFSLKKYCTNFHMYIAALDEIAYKCLNGMQLENCTVLYINDIESDELRKVKKERSRAEYCWTCASFFTNYILENVSVDQCTYIDADMMFFSNPEILVDEMISNGDSVQIVGHNYPDTPVYREMSNKFGKYCVQFNTFMNDSKGKAVIKDWSTKCIKQCSEDSDGKTFGDQKYLDDWEKDFEGVHVLKHKGGGIAPWNVGKYVLVENGKDILIKETATDDIFPLIFYHYHGFQYKNKYMINMSTLLRHETVDMNLLYILYGTYINELDKVRDLLGSSYYVKKVPNALICKIIRRLKDRVFINTIKDFARGKE